MAPRRAPVASDKAVQTLRREAAQLNRTNACSRPTCLVESWTKRLRAGVQLLLLSWLRFLARLAKAALKLGHHRPLPQPHDRLARAVEGVGAVVGVYRHGNG